ncbi:uncharacterized protein PHACADRAFT_203262, partial [Phanerochaete carnosa HHB-10118-sp]
MFNVDVLRQAQDRDDSPYVEFLSSAITASPVAACHGLPRLFKAFIQVTRRHKAAIFGQSSHQAPGASADQARQASLKFFAMCDSLLSPVNEDEIRWETKTKLLRIMNSEGLYGVNNESIDKVLSRIGEETIAGLAHFISENKQALVEYTLDILSIIVGIDYDLLAHSTPRILHLLLTVPSHTAPAYTYLGKLLDYHRKTRTLDLLVESLLEACASRALLDRSAASVSPILRHPFLDDFAKSLKSFITPGQVSGTVDTVLHHLREQLLTIVDLSAPSDDDNSRPQKKKRKTAKDGVSPVTESSTRAAVAFSLASRIACTVFSSIPTRYLEDDTKSAVTEVVQDFYAFERSKLKDILKRIRRGASSQDVHWAASSILRLQYCIKTAPSVQVSTQGDQKTASKLLSTLESPISPELRVEILHTLLNDVDLGYCESAPVFDEVLSLLEHHAGELTWSGRVHDVRTDSQATIATCHLLVSRWLPLLDGAASEAQLARFAKLMTSPQSFSQSGVTHEQIGLPSIVQRALHNAELWELHRLRDALLEQINAVTKPLDSVDVLTAVRGVHSPVGLSSDTVGAYRLLLYIPAEYLSRGIRSDLLRRALAADVLSDHGDAQTALF